MTGILPPPIPAKAHPITHSEPRRNTLAETPTHALDALRCQLPESFTPGDAKKLQNLRTGFCWGHLPALFGGVQHCLLISGSSRGAHYWYNVKLKLRQQANCAASATAMSPPSASTGGVASLSSDSGSPNKGGGISGGTCGGGGGGVVLQLVGMWGIACPRVIAG